MGQNYSNKIEDYELFAKPWKPTSVESYADYQAMRYRYGKAYEISLSMLDRIASNPEIAMAIADGVGIYHYRAGHSFVQVWDDIKLTQLERRVAGRVIESLAYLEDVRDVVSTAHDAHVEWDRQVEIETKGRQAEFGKIHEHDEAFFEMLAQIGHQAWHQVISAVTPLQLADEDSLTAWQLPVHLDETISQTISGGVVDAIGISTRTGKTVLVDIKSNHYSIRRYADDGAPWNPKNQIQLLIYFIILSVFHVISDDCDVPQPSVIAAINPVRGTVEYLSPETLLAHRDVLRTLATKALCLNAELVDRLMEYLEEVLSD